jgi:cytochrome d ubiquinol oxidase subunit I
VSFLIAGLSAWRWLRKATAAAACWRCAPASRWPRSLIPLQIFAGDMHGLNTLEHQPAKIAAMEGIWHTEPQRAAALFALPDEAAAPTTRSPCPSWPA